MSLFSRMFILLSAVLYPMTQSQAAEKSDVREKWHTPFDLYLSPVEAYEMKSADPEGIAFIDVRTRAEVKYIGMATPIDAHIPIRFLDNDYAWSKKRNTYRTQLNKHFANDVKKLLLQMKLNQTSPIILMCQSGIRVPIAAKILHKAGFEKVYTQHEGFEGKKSDDEADQGARIVNGWKQAKLPWSYDLAPEKMYFNFNSE